MLLRAKSIISHGKWGKWLADNCSCERGISMTTAERWMRLASKSSVLTDLDKRQGLMHAYGLIGILPDRQPQKSGTGTADVSIFDELVDRSALSAQRLATQLDVDLEDIPAERRQRVKEALRPIVEVYERL
jgi:hypothetical protein